MTTPTVSVLATGGTIASEPDEDGAAPAKSGEQLLESIPVLDDLARFRVREVCSRPGFDMRWKDVLATAERAIQEVETRPDDDTVESIDGIVITHGTDTLADTAFALDLLTDLPVPVVVTGAQRRLDEPSSDVPANMIAAVRAATDFRFASGVHVAFDNEIHAARDVVKTHTSALDTFQSPGKGPVATLTRNEIHLHREPERQVSVPPLFPIDPESIPEVAVIHSGTGVGERALENIKNQLESDANSRPGGVVVQGTGLGNVTGALGTELVALAKEIPVVVGSRCHAGTTEPVYGTAGGAVTLEEGGIAFADDLSTAKARVKLSLGLAAGLDVETFF